PRAGGGQLIRCQSRDDGSLTVQIESLVRTCCETKRIAGECAEMIFRPDDQAAKHDVEVRHARTLSDVLHSNQIPISRVRSPLKPRGRGPAVRIDLPSQPRVGGGQLIRCQSRDAGSWIDRAFAES